MDTNEGTDNAAGYQRAAWTTVAVLVGLTVGAIAGLRLAASAAVTAHRPVAVAPISAAPGRDDERSRLVERVDHSTMTASDADTLAEPGTSIAAYGD